MDVSTHLLPILGLTLYALGGLTVALYIAKRLGRFLNFRTLVILNYVVVSPVSGIVHLMQLKGASRGYFDVSTATDQGLVNATLGSILGLFALCLACLLKLPGDDFKPTHLPEPWLITSEKRFIVLATLLMLPVTIFATLQIQAYVRTTELTRVIVLNDGMARFSFISNWLVWVVSFLALLIIGGRAGKSRVVTLLVTAAATLAIVASLSWTGGRSVIIVMVLPLILVVLPKLSGLRWLAVPAAITAATAYIISVSENRSSVDRGFNVATWLDWEWGRYSMTGFATEYVENNGYVFGESFLAGITSVLLGILRLIGLPIPNPPLHTSTQMSGQHLLNSTTLVHIVPGLNAELFMNFGMFGIIGGCFVLGRVTCWVDRKYQQAPTAIVKLAFAYVGTLLVFRTVSADSGSIYSYLIYVGAPLLLAGWYSTFTRRRDKQRLISEDKASARHKARQSVLAPQQPAVPGKTN